ncbi:hypothetical protein CEXT_627321 [Caerostris extrusa]|uniref:Uncharacterized protein n=1 Tax=Caerostris extrusa TaxID=172846 RepID=A0AAV4U2X2_CAEEX|nr:hypothetical protein CEXT_627321 [Caerostris extrusa]
MANLINAGKNQLQKPVYHAFFIFLFSADAILLSSSVQQSAHSILPIPVQGVFSFTVSVGLFQLGRVRWLVDSRPALVSLPP